MLVMTVLIVAQMNLCKISVTGIVLQFALLIQQMMILKGREKQNFTTGFTVLIFGASENRKHAIKF